MQSTSARSRPTGVTIIGILDIISGAIMLVLGLGLIAIGTIMIPYLHIPGMHRLQALNSANFAFSHFPRPFFGPLAVSIGSVIAAIGIASLVIAYGIFHAKGWAWTATVIISIISIVGSAASIAAGNAGAVVNVIINAIILYYVYRPRVKAYFGKGLRTGTAGTSTAA
jgi:hypothetical protein